MSGAVAGAWLGLQTTTDMISLLAAIAGAIAVANLALIVLDMTQARSVARVSAPPQPTQEPVQA